MKKLVIIGTILLSSLSFALSEETKKELKTDNYKWNVKRSSKESINTVFAVNNEDNIKIMEEKNPKDGFLEFKEGLIKISGENNWNLKFIEDNLAILTKENEVMYAKHDLKNNRIIMVQSKDQFFNSKLDKIMIDEFGSVDYLNFFQ